MKKFKIPTPKFLVFNSEKDGIRYIKKQKNSTWYIKASGLAAGKGAIMANSNIDAIEKIKQMKSFGAAGKTYLLEKVLVGEEFSSFAVVDGKNFKILGHAQDHKTVYNGNLGPNTGGMGCSAPPQLINKKIENQINIIFKKTTEGLVSIKRNYQGILYLGGIVGANNKVSVIEFNARWGDPEAQVLIPSIRNDFYEMANQVINKSSKNLKIIKDNLYRIAVTVAARGYPDDYSKSQNMKISGINKIKKLKDIKIYGAGIKKVKNSYQVSGGRILYLTVKGKDVISTRKFAYGALSAIYVQSNKGHFREDIGFRDLERYYQKRS